jgi:hypothetical protein
MHTARTIKHLVVKLPSRVGLLADMATTIRKAGVNLSGVLAYEMVGMGEFMFITSDDEKAAAALASFGAEISYEDVVSVVLPNELGALESVTRKIADAGINIGYVYGTTGTDTATIVFRTDDPAATVRAVG